MIRINPATNPAIEIAKIDKPLPTEDSLIKDYDPNELLVHY
jgi:hypothetical protein